MSEPETVGEARKVEVAAAWLYGFYHGGANRERLSQWLAEPEKRRERFRDAARDLFRTVEELPELPPRLASQPASAFQLTAKLTAKEKGRAHCGVMRTCPMCRGLGEVTLPKPLTPRQLQVLDAIRGYIAEHRVAPSYAEIGQLIGARSLHSVFDHVHALVRKRYLTLEVGQYRGIRLVES